MFPRCVRQIASRTSYFPPNVWQTQTQARPGQASARCCRGILQTHHRGDVRWAEAAARCVVSGRDQDQIKYSVCPPLLSIWRLGCNYILFVERTGSQLTPHNTPYTSFLTAYASKKHLNELKILSVGGTFSCSSLVQVTRVKCGVYRSTHCLVDCGERIPLLSERERERERELVIFLCWSSTSSVRQVADWHHWNWKCGEESLQQNNTLDGFQAPSKNI